MDIEGESGPIKARCRVILDQINQSLSINRIKPLRSTLKRRKRSLNVPKPLGLVPLLMWKRQYFFNMKKHIFMIHWAIKDDPPKNAFLCVGEPSSVVHYGSFDPFGGRRSLSSFQKTTPILIDFYRAMVDLGPSSRMIQLTLTSGLLKPEIQNTMWLYQHHLPTVAYRDNIFGGFCPTKDLHHHYCFQGRQVFTYF
jgi:hypothetical protein